MENLPAIPDPNEFDDFTIPVQNVYYPIKLSDGEVIECDLENTSLYYFKGVLEIMNHVYYMRESGQPLYLFSSKKVMDEMKDLGFDRYISCTPPTVFDLKVFFGYAKQRLDIEATKYLEGK